MAELPGESAWSVIPDFKAVRIRSFLTQNVTAGSTIYTDGLKSFSGLLEAGFLSMSFATNLSGRNCEKAQNPRSRWRIERLATCNSG